MAAAYNAVDVWDPNPLVYINNHDAVSRNVTDMLVSQFNKDMLECISYEK